MNSKGGQGDPTSALKRFQKKFAHFQAVLEHNNRVLKVMAEMDERAHGGASFDMDYVQDGLDSIRGGVKKIISRLNALGENRYESLWERYDAMNTEIYRLWPGREPALKDDYTVPLSEVNSQRAASVGSKSAQLGELKTKLGLPVPEGFAITAWAYRRFVEANQLESRILERLREVDIRSYQDLEQASSEIQYEITSSPVPKEIARAIREGAGHLAARVRHGRFSMRSSAIGEDTLLSFAGQYATYLNLNKHELVERYRSILASKYTPKAIYYLLSHSLEETDPAMGATCMAMVDAIAAGVIYTVDPVHPYQDAVLINSIFGLGKHLVDGTLTPDTFRVSRQSLRILESHIVTKPVRLELREEGGTIEHHLAPQERDLPSLTDDQVTQLTQYALKIEEHYGAPQDIEWAIDRDGQVFILQARPLMIIERAPSDKAFDMSGQQVRAGGGTTVHPGAGSGPVFHVTSPGDIPGVPEGAVLVTLQPFPGLITVLGKVSALVTSVGGIASHMATIAREFHVPTIVGVEGSSHLGEGEMVTVDASKGVIYAGVHPDLVAARKTLGGEQGKPGIAAFLQRVLAKVTPLNLIQVNDPGFVPERCRTFHDITRFAHQMAMEEMFTIAFDLEGKERLSVKLRTDIPLDVYIIQLDREPSDLRRRSSISIDEINSIPFTALWEGILAEGWPSGPQAPRLAPMATTSGARRKSKFAEDSFAIVSREYMILSLQMGYHMATVEAMCTEQVSKNYIRKQLKQGGAIRERRIRRIQLITDILSAMGFDHHGRGDFLDSSIAYQDCEAIRGKLHLLGRLTILTKQLDMALSSDAITDWYKTDFMKILGLYDDDEHKR